MRGAIGRNIQGQLEFGRQRRSFLRHSQGHLQTNRSLDFHEQPPAGLAAEAAGHEGRGHGGDGALDGIGVDEAQAWLGEQLAPLTLPAAFRLKLPGVAVADMFALHGRGFALLAVLAQLLAAAIVGIAGFERWWRWFALGYPYRVPLAV